MTPLYMLSLFYPSLDKAQATVREAKILVEKLSGKDYRLVAMGTGYCALGFVSDTPQDDIREQLKRLPASEGGYLLVEVTRVVAGSMTQDTMQWWAKHYRG